MPAAETLDRDGWAEINLGTLASLLDPVAGRLEQRTSSAGPLAGPIRAAAGATLAAEAGLVVGYMSQRVLGQYELSLLQPEVPARLLFVGPNLERAIVDLRVPREPFLRWVALHELTHAFQFAGVPWLRAHMGSLLRDYLKTVEVRIERGAAGGLPMLPDVRKIVETFREGGLAALVQSREQREIMRKVQAAMAVIEGYSEHVMDAVGAELLAGPGSAQGGDGAPAPQPLGSRAGAAAPPRLRPQAAPVRAGKALLRRRRRARRDRAAEPRLGLARGASQALGARSIPERWVERVEPQPAAA